ncbi:MAG: parallel beta-helix repeat protein (two copies), partial [Dehalococcoidia bacterium]|nr:parallel beta-helix repeat protein (two copies) [Dehalococcoidia bacterium]
MKPYKTNARLISLAAVTFLLLSLLSYVPGDSGLRALNASNLLVTPNRFVATTGSDASVDCSSTAPCATIQRAVDVSVNGDIISVATGTYTENVTVNKDVHILGAGGITLAPSFVPNQTTNSILNASGGDYGFLIEGNSVTIQGMVVQNASFNGIS